MRDRKTHFRSGWACPQRVCTRTKSVSVIAPKPAPTAQRSTSGSAASDSRRSNRTKSIRLPHVVHGAHRDGQLGYTRLLASIEDFRHSLKRAFPIPADDDGKIAILPSGGS